MPEEVKRSRSMAGMIFIKWQLALAYKEGIGTEASKKDYVEWMHRAAEDNDIEAMFNLADAYQKGIGVGRDEAQYFSWTRKMAEKGSPIALLNLAEAYRSGIGVQRDKREFFQNATKAMGLAKEALRIEEAAPDFASEDLPKAFQLVAEA